MKQLLYLVLVTFTITSCDTFTTEYNVAFDKREIKGFDVLPNGGTGSHKGKFLTQRDSDNYQSILDFLQKHQGKWDAYVEGKAQTEVIIGVIEENPVSQIPRENSPLQSPTYQRTTVWVGTNYIGIGYPEPKLKAGEASFFKIISEKDAKRFIEQLRE